MLSRSPRFTAVAAMGVAALSILAAAVPTGSEVALAPDGDGVIAQGGEVLALTPTSAIVVTEGADGIISPDYS